MKKLLTLLLTMPILLSFFSCGLVQPSGADTGEEFDFCLYVLSVLFIFQERIPADPYVFGTAAELYKSVNDPYTRYLEPDQAQSLLSALTTESGGIGILIDSTAIGYAIKEVFKNSPGEKAGLLAGDTIVEAGDASLAGVSLDSISNFLHGDLGTEKILSVKRGDSLVTITVLLGTYLAPSVHADSLDSNTAYIMLTIFSATTPHTLGSTGEFEDALDKTAWARSTILDIRHNGGGALGQCVAITSQFVPESTVIINVRERDVDSLHPDGVTAESSLLAEKGQKALARSFYVLVDESSASASEILVSCLKDRRSQDVHIVGTKTFGKGSGWTYLTTPQNAMVTITRMLFTPIYGAAYNLVGITPDIVIDSTGDAKLAALDLINGGSGLGKRNAAVEYRRFEWYRKQLLPKPWIPMCVVN